MLLDAMVLMAMSVDLSVELRGKTRDAGRNVSLDFLLKQN